MKIFLINKSPKISETEFYALQKVNYTAYLECSMYFLTRNLNRLTSQSRSPVHNC